MVFVLDENGERLFPCKERRARRLMERGEAKPYWQKGFFCIRLLRSKSEKREEYPKIALGLDPGSKREGYTAGSSKGVVINITTDTRWWIKDAMLARRNLRHARRGRNAPYREERLNRSCLKNKGVPPSTKARWDVKLKVISILNRLMPISVLVVEDIKVRAVKDNGTKETKRWNVAFSTMQIGKSYFYREIVRLYPEMMLIKKEGYETATHRNARGFGKTEGKKKMLYVWESHNSDSHSLMEMGLGSNVKPYKGLIQVNFLHFYRRQLHVQNFAKGGVRRRYGGTVSAHMGRGSVMRDLKMGNLVLLGGGKEDGDRVAIHDIRTGKRLNQFKKVLELQHMYNNRIRMQYPLQQICLHKDSADIK